VTRVIMVWWGEGGGRGGAGLGEGHGVARAAPAGRQEPSHGSNRWAADVHVRQRETGEMGTPTGGPGPQ
jgi:hypothetical protein